MLPVISLNHYQSGPPREWKGRSPFVWRYIARDLSKLLISLLIFLAPLTFSNNKIPNFQPDCETSNLLKERNRITIAVTHRPPSRVTRVFSPVFQINPPPPIVNPTLELSTFPTAPRAPPVSRLV